MVILMENDEDTRIFDLEECVFLDYKHTKATFCKGCDGYNYNCISYKSIRNDLKEYGSSWQEYKEKEKNEKVKR